MNSVKKRQQSRLVEKREKDDGKEELVRETREQIKDRSPPQPTGITLTSASERISLANRIQHNLAKVNPYSEKVNLTKSDT